MRAINLLFGACVATLTLLLLQTPGSATLLQVMSIEDLYGASTHIVEGRVLEIKGFWNRKRTAIFTWIILERRRTLKGQLPKKVDVFVPGGTAGEQTTLILGGPSFKVGEDVVVFLKPSTDYEKEVDLPKGIIPYHLTDFFQGKFNVNENPISGEKRVVSNLADQSGIIANVGGKLPPGGKLGLMWKDLTLRLKNLNIPLKHDNLHKKTD